jgi:hypothetical protein
VSYLNLCVNTACFIRNRSRKQTEAQLKVSMYKNILLDPQNRFLRIINFCSTICHVVTGETVKETSALIMLAALLL